MHANSFFLQTLKKGGNVAKVNLYRTSIKYLWNSFYLANEALLITSVGICLVQGMQYPDLRPLLTRNETHLNHVGLLMHMSDFVDNFMQYAGQGQWLSLQSLIFNRKVTDLLIRLEWQ